MMKIKASVIPALSLCWAAGLALADTTDIREWLVPWEKSEPGHAYVDARGHVWFLGQRNDYIANFSPESSEFSRYDLPKGSMPTSLLVDANRTLWFASSRHRYIGSLNPATGRVTEITFPDKKAKDPRALVFDNAGDIWFTVQNSNFVGRVKTSTNEVDLISVPTRKVRPYGITVNTKGIPWAAGSRKNILVRINPEDLSVTEVETPNDESRFREIVTTSDDRVWFPDYELGTLGSFDPRNGQFMEWPLPGGSDSRPFGMAVDRNDRIWIVETGGSPNRLVGFETETETFLTTTDIPSGAGSVDHLHYHELSGEIWFGTSTNYIGRAKVH